MRRRSDGRARIFTDRQFLLILLVLTKPLGSGLARLIAAVPLPGVAGVERILWRTLGITDHEMNWRQYLLALLTLNLLGLGILFCLLFWQEWLPLNPQRLPGLSWDLALNTAVSFVTNTNWQAYSGESTLSYFSQMAGLTVQNFLSAATGIAVVLRLSAPLRARMCTRWVMPGRIWYALRYGYYFLSR